MQTSVRRMAFWGLCSLLCLLGSRAVEAAGRVTLMQTPEGGIQPQAAVDSQGVVHLIYFKGNPQAGDIFYTRLKPGQARFSDVLRVNSQPGSVIAVGTIRGAQLAIGKDDRVHVVWNGSDSAQPKGPGGTPMLYTHLNGKRDGFEPQRNLIHWAGGLDGGGSVAADAQGHVYVVWHAMGRAKDEAGRAVFVAQSNNSGETFSSEKQANPLPTGACGCCGLKTFTDRAGMLYILYRAAGDKVNRDMTLLVSKDQGGSFQAQNIHKWLLNSCPMSSASLTQNREETLAAWETKEQVYYASIHPADLTLTTPTAAPGSALRKHPVVVSNAKGETLFAWTEGTGWNRGGSLAWQVYDASGRPTEIKGRANGVPVWGLLSAFARPDSNFVILY